MPYIDSEGARIFYRLEGASGAPVVVLASSLGATHEMWEPQVAALADRFRILRYDHRGHGRSGATEGPYDIDLLGLDLLNLINNLGLRRVHLCGISMGGMIAMVLAAHAAERIDRVVLANTADAVEHPEPWDERIAAVETGGMAAIADGVAERWFTPAFRERAPETVERVRAMLTAADPKGYVACCAAVRDHDAREELGMITRPTLVIGGRHDQATPPALAERIAAGIPGARLEMFDCAHLSSIEQADDFNAALLDHLTG
jgi:3-oxoadipate enol-lactonase